MLNQHGGSFIETLIALTIVTIAITPLLKLTDRSSNSVTKLKRKQIYYQKITEPNQPLRCRTIVGGEKIIKCKSRNPNKFQLTLVK